MSRTSNASRAAARQAAETMYAADAATRQLGIEIDGVEPGRARAQMTITPSMVNGHGIAHGGYVFLLADTALAFASNSHGEPALTKRCEISFLRPAKAGDKLMALAVESKRAGRDGTYEVQVTRGDGEVVARLHGQSRTVSHRVFT